MKILLLRQDIELLKKAGIFHDENKEYSDDEALDLLETVRDLEISYSQFERGHEFDLYVQYGLIADRIHAQIPEN